MSINQTRSARFAARSTSGEAKSRGNPGEPAGPGSPGIEAGMGPGCARAASAQAPGNISSLTAAPLLAEEAPDPVPLLGASSAPEGDGITDAQGAPSLSVPAEISPGDIGLWLAVLGGDSAQKSMEAQQEAITARTNEAKALGRENVKRIRDASAKAVEAERARRHRSFWGSIRHVVDLAPLHLIVASTQALIKSGGDPKALAGVGMAALKALNDICSLVQIPKIEPSAWVAEAVTPMFREMGMSKEQADAWGRIAASCLEYSMLPGMIAVDPNSMGQLVGASMELDGYDKRKADEIAMWTTMAVGLAAAVGCMGYAAYTGVRFATQMEQLATTLQRVAQTYEGISQVSKGLTDMEVAMVTRTLETFKADAIRISARFKETTRQQQEQSDVLSEINQRMQDIDKIAAELLKSEYDSLMQITRSVLPTAVRA